MNLDRLAPPTTAPDLAWDELTENGKIERLRTIVRSQRDTIDYLQSRVWTLTSQMLNHVHVDGAVLVPANSVGDSGVNVPRTFDEAYF